MDPVSGRLINSFKKERDRARLDFNKKEFVRTVLELARTAIEVARTHYAKRDVTSGDASRLHAKNIYEIALKYFGELSDSASKKDPQLLALSKQIKKALAAHPKHGYTRGAGSS